MTALRRAVVVALTLSLAGCGDRRPSQVGKDSAPVDLPHHHDLRADSPSPVRYERVRAGGYASCAIRSDHRLVCWGDAGPAPTEGSFRDVAPGTSMGCAIRLEDSGISCWGTLSNGPIEPPAGRFAEVAASGEWFCALDDTGSPRCWGNRWPQNPYASPPKVTDLQGLSMGDCSACALDQDRHRVCWGCNGKDISGTGKPMTEVVPSALKLRKITARSGHICVVTATELAARCYRSSGNEAPFGGGRFVEISARHMYICATTETGSLTCKDYITNHQPGDPPPSRAKPPSGVGFSSLTTAGGHACAIDSSGMVRCWGDNSANQLAVPPLP